MTPEEKLKKIILYLQNEIAEGYRSLGMARGLLHALRAGDLPDSWFFNGAYRHSKQQAVLSLAKMLVHQNQSISVKMLLDHVEMHMRPINPTEPSNPKPVKDLIRAQRDYLDPAKTLLIPKIEKLRNRTIAHTDRRHITEPEAVEESIDHEEIELCLSETLKLVNTYNKIFFESQFFVFNIEQEIENEVDHIVMWRRAYIKSVLDEEERDLRSLPTLGP